MTDEVPRAEEIHRVACDGGRYTLTCSATGRVGIMRHSQPWVYYVAGASAIACLMAELDAARVVLAAARAVVHPDCPARDIVPRLERAIAEHDALVDDQQEPSAWTRL